MSVEPFDAQPVAVDTIRPEPGVAKSDPILVADGIRRAFGGLVAVDVEHAEIQRNQITALIGPNGAGKTTFFNLLTGFDQPNSGRWQFDGRELGGKSPHQVARLGMVRTFQLTKSLARLSVIQNMRLGATGQLGERIWAAPLPFLWNRQEAAITERAEELLARFRLDHMRDEFAGNLSGGQRKLLEMARALMTDPSLIMLDEPMAGVNPALKQSLLEHITLLRDEGRSVLFVEHDMDMVHEISDWVLVMAEGRLIAEGTATQISGDQRVIDAYLGAHHDVDLGAMDEESAIAQLGLDAEELGVDTLQQITAEHEESDWGDEAEAKGEADE
ncbi:ABC transporter ATP-binding protein [Desertimonas flava]|uniref:ABC transporter ATP-binding protein n=1 Tax=Desertimonas flava TaxID=2064846 RepID=UPI000E357DA8|nr:ABC transporter ATP-binding protein [Desertimonas flava]